jgi:hypothetical protein
VVTDNTDGEWECGADAHAVSREAGLARGFEAFCVIMFISGFRLIPAAPANGRSENELD